MNNSKKLLSSFLASAGFLSIIIGGVFWNNFSGVNVTEAATSDVTGYAWSDNIGWIQFNPKSTSSLCAAANCGVSYDDTTGQFSGYAWSDNIGWFYFGPDITGKILSSSAPETPKQWVMGLSGVISGWGIAYRAVETEGQTLGGWDGWTKFDKSGSQTLNPASIILADGLQKGELHGYVWASDVVGWVSLSCKEGGSTANDICLTSNYQVKASLSNVNITPLSVTCSGPSSANVGDSVTFVANPSGGTGSYTYSWTGDWEIGNLGANSSLTFVKDSALQTATVTVGDSSGNATSNCSVSVSVNVGGGPYMLEVNKGNSAGTGTVKSSVDGGATYDNKIDCGVNCSTSSTSYDSGTKVTLIADPDVNSDFAGWFNNSSWTEADKMVECLDTGATCAFTMPGASKTVYAKFNKKPSCVINCTDGPYTLTVIKTPSAEAGTVKSDPNGIDCDTTCSFSSTDFSSGLRVTLTAKAFAGWTFLNWTGCDAVNGKQCDVNMTENKIVTARFGRIKIIEI